MTPGKRNSPNHVPKANSGAARDNAKAVTRLEPDGKIPQRRESHERPVRLEPGLRIDGTSRPKPTKKESQRLKITEISPTVVRLKADAPPPRVERIVAFHEFTAPAAENHQNRGEGGEWGRKHSISLRWVLGMGATVVALVVLGMIALPYINAPNAVAPTASAASGGAVSENNPTDIDAMANLLSQQPEAMSIYRSFLAAAHPDDILPIIRHSEAMEEVLRQRWKPAQVPRDWQPSPDSGWLVKELAGHPCALLSGRLPDNTKFLAYFTAEYGPLLLDWKATTGYGTASFEDLAEGDGDGSEIRGEITSSDFYSQAFPEATYQAYRFTSPDRKDSIWCYAARDTPASAVLAREFQGGTILENTVDSVKVTLALEHGPAGTQPNQWLIRNLIRLDWVAR